MSQINHPNVVKFFGTLIVNSSSLGIVMELCDRSLDDLIRNIKTQGTHLDELFIWNAVGEIASAMSFIHSVKLMHRDLKPKNILLLNGVTCKVSDFGLAKYAEITSTTLGTPVYEAPEILSKTPYTNAVDVWAFGCIVHEMASLSLAFTSVNEIVNVSFTPAAIPSTFGPKLQPLISAMLSKDPSLRPSMGDVSLFNYTNLI